MNFNDPFAAGVAVVLWIAFLYFLLMGLIKGYGGELDAYSGRAVKLIMTVIAICAVLLFVHEYTPTAR